jgi:hypothetical protein
MSSPSWLHALGAYLAERATLSLDRRLRARPSRLTLRGGEGAAFPRRRRVVGEREEPDRDGQYFHYLAMWLYALSVLGQYEPAYREKGIALARDIHGPFVVPGSSGR